MSEMARSQGVPFVRYYGSADIRIPMSGGETMLIIN